MNIKTLSYLRALKKMTILAFLATITGIVIGLASVPQAIKIFKRKSAKDISILTYSILIIGAIIWLLYGIELTNFPLIIMNSLGFIIFSLVIIGWFLYGRGS